jgi:hypothetical protein
MILFDNWRRERESNTVRTKLLFYCNINDLER